MRTKDEIIACRRRWVKANQERVSQQKHDYWVENKEELMSKYRQKQLHRYDRIPMEKADHGKAMALWRAGWTLQDVADELNVEPEELRVYIEEHT